MARRRIRNLRGAPWEHSQAFATTIESATEAVRRGEKAKTCGDMFNAAIESSILLGQARRETDYFDKADPFVRKQADAKLDKLNTRAIKLEEKIRAKCLVKSTF